LKLPVSEARGTYHDIFSGEQKKIRKNREIELEPWEYLVLTGD
jgi:hypothetical protein